jgi:hypothetical protein
MDRTYCHNYKNIRIDQLSDIVLGRLNSHIDTLSDDGEVARHLDLSRGLKNKTDAIRTELAELGRRLGEMPDNLKSIYADKVSGLISSEEFLILKRGFQADIDDANLRKSTLERELSVLQAKEIAEGEKLALISKHKHIDTLTRQIINVFVEKIVIGEKTGNERNVQIYWAI